MPQRSQARVQDRLPKPPITNILPDSVSLAGAGAVGRTLAALSAVGGTPGFTYAIVNAGGLSIVLNGNLIVTNANPYGTAGAKTVTVSATDAQFQSKTESIAVTVT